MKIKKIGAIAAALAVTSLAMSASASNLPESAPTDAGVASVKAVAVDLSTIDFSEVPEGELVVAATIDPDSFDDSVVTVGVCAATEAIAVDVDVDGLELSDFVEPGELVVIGPVDPASVSGGTATQAANK